MATIRIIDNHSELNSVGCHFFTTANESQVTRVSSTKLRWLSLRTQAGDYFTEEQGKAMERIKSLEVNNGKSSGLGKLNMRILLFCDPTKESPDDAMHIFKLLKAEADIRYSNRTSSTKVIIQGNSLYLSYAPDVSKVVNSGILYTGRMVNDPVIEHHKCEFDSIFDSARKLTIRNEKIVFEDVGLSRIWKAMRSISAKDWILLILGALLGALLPILI